MNDVVKLDFKLAYRSAVSSHTIKYIMEDCTAYDHKPIMPVFIKSVGKP